MKLIILKTNLKEGLSVVERIVSENNSLPILKNILLKTVNGKIKISSTNLEIGISKFIFGKIIEEGGITIPFIPLHNIISNINAERVSIETISGNLVVKTDNYQARIQGINEEEFPIIPKIEDTSRCLEISSAALKDALTSIMSAAQFSEIRPELSGILFDFQVTILKLVATDSFRLAEKTIFTNQFKTGFQNGFKVIVPLRTIQEVTRTFPKDQTMKLYFDQHQVLFAAEDEELISRLINGQYPDYEQIIPKAIETELSVPRETFINAVRLVSSFSGKVNDIKLKVRDDGKTMEVFSSNQYLGENNYLVPVKTKGGHVDNLSFNWRYLMDGLKILSGETIIFGVNGDSKPAVLKSQEDNSYFYILMPIKAA